MNILALITTYIEAHQLAWSPTTQKSERARLRAVGEYLDGNPAKLWKAIETRAPYTRLTTWQRVQHFWDWCQEQGEVEFETNPYTQWRQFNARVFKGVYESKKPEMSFDEAKARIETLEPATRKRALEYLNSGMRYFERAKLRPDGKVEGKGKRVRDVFMPPVEGPEYTGNYRAFLRALAKVGLKPHDLRKLFASKVVEEGATAPELMDIMGWSDIRLVLRYVSASKGRKRSIMEKVHGGTNASELKVS
jgi:integrase